MTCGYCTKRIRPSLDPIQKNYTLPCEHKYHIGCLLESISECVDGEWPMCSICHKPLSRKFLSNILDNFQSIVYKQRQLYIEEYRTCRLKFLGTSCKIAIYWCTLQKKKAKRLEQLKHYYINVLKEALVRYNNIKKSMEQVDRARRVLHLQYTYVSLN